MKSGGKQWAVFLIFCGALILLSKTGLVGTLISYILPFALVGLGYIGIKNGVKILGWLLVLIGSLIIVAKFSGLISLVIAISLIFIGIRLWKKQTTYC